MDEVDRHILSLLSQNARMTVKEIAKRVSLTSPAVSERIRRMEKSGVIAGYTVRQSAALTQGYICAIISIQVLPPDRPAFHRLLDEERSVEQCLQVTGAHSHMVKVCCKDIEALEKIISQLQKLGQTNTQIILSSREWDGPVF